MFLHLSVSHSVHRGGVCPSACWDTPPPSRHSLGQTPPGQTPPRADTPPQQTATAADGTHPTGMHSCYKIIVTFGRLSCSGVNQERKCAQASEKEDEDEMPYMSKTR